MPEPIVIEGLLAKVEATYGTDSTPVAGTDDAVLSGPFWPLPDIAHQFPNLRDMVVSGGGGSLLPVAPAGGQGRIARFSLGIEPRPKGSAYAATGDLRGLGALLRMGGLSVTLNASGLDYTWISASIESGTIWAYAGGNVYKFNGCYTKPRLVFRAGELVQVFFDVVGLLRIAPAVAAVPAITYLAQAAPAVVGAAATVGAWSPDFENLELDMGAEIQVRPNGNQVDGLRLRMSRHRPRVKILTESIALATYDPYADALATATGIRTARTSALTIPGAGAGSRIKLQGVTGYIDTARHVDVTGFTGHELDYIVTAGTLRFD